MRSPVVVELKNTKFQKISLNAKFTDFLHHNMIFDLYMNFQEHLGQAILQFLVNARSDWIANGLSCIQRDRFPERQQEFQESLFTMDDETSSLVPKTFETHPGHQVKHDKL